MSETQDMTDRHISSGPHGKWNSSRARVLEPSRRGHSRSGRPCPSTNRRSRLHRRGLDLDHRHVGIYRHGRSMISPRRNHSQPGLALAGPDPSCPRKLLPQVYHGVPYYYGPRLSGWQLVSWPGNRNLCHPPLHHDSIRRLVKDSVPQQVLGH